MPFVPFDSRFPDLARSETRVVTTMAINTWRLPPAHYGFREMYCDERGCDCRRAMLWVASSERPQAAPEAVIGYGWESADYYRLWIHGDLSAAELAELQGPALVLGGRQGPLAPALLRVFREVVLPNGDYRERLLRHYQLFRKAIDGSTRRARGKKRGR